MRKVLTIAAAALVLVSLGVGTTGYDGPTDQPHIMGGGHDHNHSYGDDVKVNDSNIPDRPVNKTEVEVGDSPVISFVQGIFSWLGF